MPAPLRLTLTAEEERTLSELRQAKTVPQRTRDRAHILRLNAKGMNVLQIAEIFECHPHTVRATLRRWETKGLGGLWEAPGRGAKPKLSESDREYLTEMIDNEPRTYNSKQLARKLKEERAVDLSSDRPRRILKKKRISLETNEKKSKKKTGYPEKKYQAGRVKDVGGYGRRRTA